MSRKNYKKNKTKAQRRQWWNSLNLEQREDYIKGVQARKAKQRELNPPKELEFNPKYPWMTEGVNSKNRKRWIEMIKRKNPWLKVA